MKRGVPPTALKARTGEFTPPGVTAWARSNQSADRGVGAAERVVVGGTQPLSPTPRTTDEPPAEPSRRGRLKCC